MPPSPDDESDSGPIVGDGAVTLPAPEEQEEDRVSVIDISPNVANVVLTETTANLQANNRDGRAIATAAMGSLTAGIAKTHNELGPAESRAISGVMATPVAAPATGG